MKSQDIAIVGILLAVGAIVRYLSLIIPGPIVSNLVIAFYCLAIILVIPTFTEVIGIGIVAGIVCALLSHSIFPLQTLLVSLWVQLPAWSRTKPSGITFHFPLLLQPL